MSILAWSILDAPYESAIEKGVLYSDSAITWNGLVSVNEISTNNEFSTYFEGVRNFNGARSGEFNTDIETFTYPEVLEDKKSIFTGFSYQTKVGVNRYRIHLVYNPIFYLDSKNHVSNSEIIEPELFSWKMSTTAIMIDGFAPFSHLYIDVDSVNKDLLTSYLEQIFYGSEENNAYIPAPTDLIRLFEENPSSNILLVLDHGDGSWTAVGSDEVVKLLDDTSFEIDSPSAMMLNQTTYTVESI